MKPYSPPTTADYISRYRQGLYHIIQILLQQSQAHDGKNQSSDSSLDNFLLNSFLTTTPKCDSSLNCPQDVPSQGQILMNLIRRSTIEEASPADFNVFDPSSIEALSVLLHFAMSCEVPKKLLISWIIDPEPSIGATLEMRIAAVDAFLLAFPVTPQVLFQDLIQVSTSSTLPSSKLPLSKLQFLTSATNARILLNILFTSRIYSDLITNNLPRRSSSLSTAPISISYSDLFVEIMKCGPLSFSKFSTVQIASSERTNTRALCAQLIVLSLQTMWTGLSQSLQKSGADLSSFLTSLDPDQMRKGALLLLEASLIQDDLTLFSRGIAIFPNDWYRFIITQAINDSINSVAPRILGCLLSIDSPPAKFSEFVVERAKSTFGFLSEIRTSDCDGLFERYRDLVRLLLNIPGLREFLRKDTMIYLETKRKGRQDQQEVQQDQQEVQQIHQSDTSIDTKEEEEHGGEERQLLGYQQSNWRDWEDHRKTLQLSPSRPQPHTTCHSKPLAFSKKSMPNPGFKASIFYSALAPRYSSQTVPCPFLDLYAEQLKDIPGVFDLNLDIHHIIETFLNSFAVDGGGAGSSPASSSTLFSQASVLNSQANPYTTAYFDFIFALGSCSLRQGQRFDPNGLVSIQFNLRAVGDPNKHSLWGWYQLCFQNQIIARPYSSVVEHLSGPEGLGRGLNAKIHIQPTFRIPWVFAALHRGSSSPGGALLLSYLRSSFNRPINLCQTLTIVHFGNTSTGPRTLSVRVHNKSRPDTCAATAAAAEAAGAASTPEVVVVVEQTDKFFVSQFEQSPTPNAPLGLESACFLPSASYTILQWVILCDLYCLVTDASRHYNSNPNLKTPQYKDATHTHLYGQPHFVIPDPKHEVLRGASTPAGSDLSDVILCELIEHYLQTLTEHEGGDYNDRDRDGEGVDRVHYPVGSQFPSDLGLEFFSSLDYQR